MLTQDALVYASQEQYGKGYEIDKMFDGNEKTYWKSLKESKPESVTIVFREGLLNVESISIKPGNKTSYEGKIFTEQSKWARFTPKDAKDDTKYELDKKCSQIRFDLTPQDQKECVVFEIKIFLSK